MARSKLVKYYMILALMGAMGANAPSENSSVGASHQEEFEL